MKLKLHQWGELFGMLLLLASTAAQIFYVEPLKREIEWRLAAFSMQQNAQVQTRAMFDTRLAVLKAVNAPADALKQTEVERDSTLERFRNADANISDYLTEKTTVEDGLQMIVLALFALGTLLAGLSRAIEMQAQSTGR